MSGIEWPMGPNYVWNTQPVCTCQTCPCCGGRIAAQPYRFTWQWMPHLAPIYQTTTGTVTASQVIEKLNE